MNLPEKKLKPLKQSNLSDLTSDIVIPTPKYDRENTSIGIVHIGPGAFHRSHQAFHTENAMQLSGGDWAICGVSLRQGSPRDTLAKQDNLYTLAVLDKNINYRIIGSIKEFLVANGQIEEVLSRMTASSTKIVTLTITEKGYCLTSDGLLDLNNPDIKLDLKTPTTPVSAIGLLVESLRLRRRLGVKAFNVLSCDNVSGNGAKLRSAVLTFAGELDSSLRTWIDENVSFPNSMVDSITPKTEPYTIEAVSRAINLKDCWPIQREEFTQWVIEKNWQGERPNWQGVGVIFTDDVEGFEKAKLRLLNCLHSTLAYAGLLANFESVYDAVNDDVLRSFITRLSKEEIIGSFEPPRELDVNTYADDIIQRFLNPNIRHLLSQIAFDGSQKVQMRILPIIEDNLSLGRSTNLLTLSLACWFEFICKSIRAKKIINDPMQNTFMAMPELKSSNECEVVTGFLSIESIFGSALQNNVPIKAQLVKSLTALRTTDAKQISKIINETC